MTVGAAGRRQNPPPAVRSASTLSPSTLPATDASAGSPSRGGRNCRKVGGRELVTPPTASGGQLGGARLSATWRCKSCWAPCEDGSSADPLGQGELLDASSSPLSYHARSYAAVAMMTLLWRGEVTTRTTPTCRSSPPPCWVRRCSTTAPTTDLHWRRHHAPPPSTS
jgi:hypothetical protein